jgi:hypothetical protein
MRIFGSGERLAGQQGDGSRDGKCNYDGMVYRYIVRGNHFVERECKHSSLASTRYLVI